LTICLLLASGLIILNDCDQVCNYFPHYFQHFQVHSNFMFVLPQIEYDNTAFIFPSHFQGYNKNEIFLQTIGMHRMFLNVATFSVTNRSISSTKKKIDFFKHFYLIS
jgi:hypothetical protein